MTSPTSDELAPAVARLRPRGTAWLGPTLYALWQAAADELARLFARADQLRAEAHPAEIVDSLDDWEAELGLPESCVTWDQTDSERKAAVIERRTSVGALSPQFYVDLAASQGVTITIETFAPAECGLAECGLAECGGSYWRCAWRVHAPASADADHRGWLECEINKLKPAHTVVAFSYDL